jgi:large subunit ribosomal protein L2
MGKRIISQRRGRGTSTYRVRKKAFRFKPQFPQKISGSGKVVLLRDSAAHSCPLARIKAGKEMFYIPAFKGMFEGQDIKLDSKEIKEGNIEQLGNIPVKTRIYCIELHPGDGGTLVRTGGSSAEIIKVVGNEVSVMMPSKKEKKFNSKCRAIIGVAAGAGRLDKPVLKAGKQFHIKKSKSKLWPRTSAVKMNAIDHPFGSGRAKNPKSKIAKRNSPPGRRVGHLRPRRTGKK